MKRQPMPKVNLEMLKTTLTETELDIVMRFIKKNNSIRASKPKVEKYVCRIEKKVTQYGTYNQEFFDCVDDMQGKAAYVWRQVVFFVSPKKHHQCMPTLDFCDLPDSVVNNGFTANNPQIKALHDLADKVVNCIDKSNWHGVKRWGNALGQIGTPQVRKNGTIVYR